MKFAVAFLCVALVAVASGSPASSWLENVNNVVDASVSKATNIASEKGKEGLAKVKELIAQLQKQVDKAKQSIQTASSQAEQAAQKYLIQKLSEQIEKLKKVEDKLSGWMGQKN